MVFRQITIKQTNSQFLHGIQSRIPLIQINHLYKYIANTLNNDIYIFYKVNHVSTYLQRNNQIFEHLTLFNLKFIPPKIQGL